MSNARLPILRSSSTLDREDACPASPLLPQWPDAAGPWAERGTAMHRFLELYSEHLAAKRGDAYALAIREVAEEWRDDCAALDLTRLPVGEEYEPEASYALDVRTGTARRIPRPSTDGGPRYAAAGLQPGEIPGTIDVLHRTRTLVADYKSGFLPGRHRHQLMWGAAVALALRGGDTAEAQEIRLADPDHAAHSHTWDSWDLADWRAQWADRMEATERSRTATDDMVRPGPHCKHCPAWKACPAKIATVVDAQSGALVRTLNRVATGADVRATLQMLDAVQADLTHMRQSLYGAARERPIDLGDGTWLGEVETTRNKVVGEVAWPIVRDLLGQHADAAARFEVSAASIERALKGAKTAAPDAFKASVAAMKKQIMEQIEQAGGVTPKTSREVKVHRRD